MQTEHLSFLILQNFPAAAPSGATAGAPRALRGGCKQFTPPLLHGYNPCRRGALGYGLTYSLSLY